MYYACIYVRFPCAFSTKNSESCKQLRVFFFLEKNNVFVNKFIGTLCITGINYSRNTECSSNTSNLAKTKRIIYIHTSACIPKEYKRLLSNTRNGETVMRFTFQ